MASVDKDLIFFKAKETVIENFDDLLALLSKAVEKGMLDPGSALYNECLDLIDDGAILDNWDELEELTARGKVLERDIDSWLSRQGQSSISYTWPKRP
jgi:hypothetical protein